MTAQVNSTLGGEQAYLLLALHSSSETLGVAVLDCRDPKTSLRSSTFPMGRGLSNSLFSCVEELLPSASWPHLARLAVATGPGGFTGTRLTVVMARTLAQQLGCSLDGVSSFALMAPRLATELSYEQKEQPFWIVKPMQRRGTLAGRYLLQTAAEVGSKGVAVELESPRLLPEGLEVSPALHAQDDVAKDVEYLLEYCAAAHRLGQEVSWTKVLPLYPTSPLDRIG